ncbi:MAG: sugar-binding transcriptional regulator, partial [Chloroflexota bacterium]
NREMPFIRRAVARAAADLLDQLVKPGQTICIGAGRTLATVTGLMTRRHLRGVIVVPATGNAGHAGLDIDYSSVAQSAAKALGGTAYRISAPAILGAGASAPQLEASNPQIRDALVAARHAEIYFLGLGSLAGDEIFVRTGLISSVDLDAVRAAGAVGDLCGSFFSASGQACPGPFATRVVGIGLDDLRRAPLVVVCVGGEEKIPAIAGALRGRLFNTLVTDEHTARGVLELLHGTVA